jgi:hypothetical protein
LPPVVEVPSFANHSSALPRDNSRFREESPSEVASIWFPGAAVVSRFPSRSKAYFVTPCAGLARRQLVRHVVGIGCRSSKSMPECSRLVLLRDQLEWCIEEPSGGTTTGSNGSPPGPRTPGPVLPLTCRKTRRTLPWSSGPCVVATERGERLLSESYLMAREKLFPYSDDPIPCGCFGGGEYSCFASICPLCNEARDRWCTSHEGNCPPDRE